MMKSDTIPNPFKTEGKKKSLPGDNFGRSFINRDTDSLLARQENHYAYFKSNELLRESMEKAEGRVPLGSEIGSSGLIATGGFVNDDFMASLNWPRVGEFYVEMERNDPVIRSMLDLVRGVLASTSVFIDAAGHDLESQRAKVLVETALHDMKYDLPSMIKGDIGSFITYGFATTETVLKKRNGYSRDPNLNSRYKDGKYGWSRMPLRGQLTVHRWIYDDSNQLMGMEQIDPYANGTYNNPPVVIPMSKLGHFRASIEKENPYSISPLRSVIRAWKIKSTLESSEAIGAERDLTGLPILRVPEGVDLWNTNDPHASDTLTRAENIVRLAKMSRFAGFVLPNDWQLEILTTGGQRPQNTDGIINRWDARIAGILFADLLLVGTGNRSGSFALMKTKAQVFNSACEGLAAQIAGVFNQQLIPQLCAFNGFRSESFPKMRFGPVEIGIDLKELSQYVSTLSGVEGIDLDEGLRGYLRQIANFPKQSGDLVTHPEVIE